MSSKKTFGLIFTLVGTPILAGGLFWAYKSATYSMKAVQVSGSVVEAKEDTCTRSVGDGKNKREVPYTCYQPIVSYQYAGQDYKVGLSERSSNQYPVGEKFELQVDPQHPQEASTKAGLWIGPAFLSFFGLIFAGIGILFLRSYFNNKKMEAHLRANGVHIRAQVIDVGPNTSLTVNGRNPFMIRAQFNDPKTGQPIVAALTELWHDPTISGEIASDNTVEVIYDRDQPTKCMIEFAKHKKAA